jgi:hypothetical protein
LLSPTCPCVVLFFFLSPFLHVCCIGTVMSCVWVCIVGTLLGISGTLHSSGQS